MASRGLGTLTLDLVAKIGGFVEGMTKAERQMDKSARAIAARGKDLEAKFAKIGAALGTALAGGVLATGVAVKSAINHMDDLSKSAQRVGLSTEVFSRLAYAGDLADVSMEDLQTSLGKLVKSQAAAAAGTGAQAKQFEALGIAVKNSDGSLRDTSAVLSDFADRFQALGGGPEAIAAGMAIFGKSFQNIIPLLKDGSDGLRQATDEADRLGVTLSTQAGKNAEYFNDNLTRLKSAVLGVAQSVATGILPTLIDLTNQLRDATADGIDTSDAIDTLKVAIEGVISIGGSLGSTIKSFDDLFSGMGVGAGTAADAIRQLVQDAASLASIPAGIAAAADVIAAKLRGDTAAYDAAQTRYREADATFKAGLSREQRSKGASGPSILGFDPLRPGFRATDPPFSLILPKSKPFVLGSASAKTGSKHASQKSGGKSDAERDAESLKRAYDSMNESLARQIGLFGQTSEAAKTRYETEHGALVGLTQAQKDALIARAAEVDALESRNKLEEDGKRLTESLLGPSERINADRAEAAKLLAAGAISQEAYNKAIAAHQTPAEQMLSDIQFEIDLLGKTRGEIEALTAARYLGVDAMTAEGRAALDAVRSRQQLSEEMTTQIGLMDDFRKGASDAIFDFVTGAKSMKDAFKDFMDDFAKQITRAIANQWVKKLLGEEGSSGSGSAAGGAIFSWLGALLGGGHANGGSVSAGMIYPVNERGPELLSVRGRDYLMMGAGAGNITPNHMLGRGGATTLNQTFVVQGTPDRSTREQLSRQAGREAQRGLARTGR